MPISICKILDMKADILKSIKYMDISMDNVEVILRAFNFFQ